MSVERSTREQQSNPRAGAAVVTKDGEQIGKISQISGSFFKVDAPMRRDFWLSAEYVGRCEADEVQLAFEKKELDEHKLAEPGLEPMEDRSREIARDAVILTDGELLEQRARMERELAEQRKDLPVHQAEGADSGTIGEPVESELARLEEELGVAGQPASSLSSSTGAVVPERHIQPESPAEAHQRVGRDGVAGAQPMTGDVTAAHVAGGGRKPMLVAMCGAALAAAGFLTLRFLRSRRSRRSLATRGKELLEDARPAASTD